MNQLSFALIISLKRFGNKLQEGNGRIFTDLTCNVKLIYFRKFRKRVRRQCAIFNCYSHNVFSMLS